METQKVYACCLKQFVSRSFSKNFVATIALSVLGFLPLPANADIAGIRNDDNSIWASFGDFRFNYKESVTPIRDDEVGRIPSGAIGADYMTHSNLYLGLEGSYSFGGVPYKGAYLYFPDVPIDGTTQEAISTIDGKIGQGFALGKNVMVIPYGEVGFRYWDRNLGGGQTEDYQHVDVLGGVMLQVTPIKNLLFSTYLSGGTTFAAQMTTGGNTYNLGNSAMYKLGAKIGYDVSPQFEVFTTLDYDHFRFGQSPIADDGSYEPSSSTEETALRVGVAYHYDTGRAREK